MSVTVFGSGFFWVFFFYIFVLILSSFLCLKVKTNLQQCQAVVSSFKKYVYWFSGGALDEKIDTTLMSLW